MGFSAAEIDQQISSTRDHLDANLNVLEQRAASGMKKVGAMAAIGLVAGLAVAGIAFLAYRKLHRPSLSNRVQDALRDAFTDLRDDLKRRFAGRPFKVVITSGEAEESGSVWRSTARKVVPAIATTAMSGLLAQLMKRQARSSEPQARE
jgi:hypothetical protein